MSFKLKSQSPLHQDITKKVTSRQTLDKEGKSETRYYRGNSEVSPDETNILNNKEKQKNTQNRQDYERNQPNSSVQSLFDLTGISQYGEAKRAFVDLAKMTGSAIGVKSQKGYDWNSSRAVGDAFDIIGAIPAVGKAKVASEGLKLAKSVSKPIMSKLTKSLITHAIPTVGVAATNEYNKSNKKDSPLHKQKLSPKAAKAKAERDLAYAKTPDRRAKKADDQRRHRHDPSGKGKDWDHEDGRWEDPHQNRGNDGNGTKSEKGKHYRINKKS